MELKDSNTTSSGPRTAGLDDRVGSLFQPDTLLGEDYAANFRRKIPLEPERTLLLAVLEDGIRCFQENLFVVTGKRRALFDEAKDWLFSDDAEPQAAASPMRSTTAWTSVSSWKLPLVR